MLPAIKFKGKDIILTGHIKNELYDIYKKNLDLQYNNIKKIINKGPLSFDLIENNDKKDSFSTFGVPSTIIVNAIKYYKEYSDSFDPINAQSFSSHVGSEGDK